MMATRASTMDLPTSFTVLSKLEVSEGAAGGLTSPGGGVSCLLRLAVACSEVSCDGVRADRAARRACWVTFASEVKLLV